ENKEHFIRNCEHREVEQILISNTTLNDALNRPQREIAIAHPGRCLRPLAGMSPKSIEKLLEQAAQFRARRKAGRWLRVEQAHTRDAALFQATAETLGYRGNSLAMQILSQRCRLDWLRADVEAAQSVMFGTAGFLAPELHQQAPAETRGYLRNLWDLWWKSRFRFETDRSRTIPWKTHGQRPANHPHRRVGALSVLAQSWPTFRKLALASPFSAKPLVDFLQSLEHPFWSFHYTLTSERQPRKISLFGRSHALELIANHLAPIALHEERMTWKSYHQIRHSAANDQVKRCAIRLFGSLDTARPWTRRLCHHQALIQIYQDFCLNDYSDCSLCQFPEQLAQWR
ncbi:MAG: DUF2851 family protein, partial [Luteolibacter sp.]